jgi:hypothetical protein
VSNGRHSVSNVLKPLTHSSLRPNYVRRGGRTDSRIEL